MIDGYAEGLIDKADFEPRIAGLRQRIKTWEEQATTLRDEVAQRTALSLIVGRLQDFARQVLRERGGSAVCAGGDPGRLAACGLELHPTKTRIVYCKDDDRPGKYEHIAFDFLGYTFQPRRAKNRWGRYFVSFLPAISTKAATAIRQTVRGWRMASTRNNQRLEDLARLVNPVVRGWLNYYGRFYRSRCVQVLRHFNEALGKWAQRKYPRFRRRERAAMHWLGRIACRDPDLLSCGGRACGRRLECRSRMRRESHVRFWEGGGVQVPSATPLRHPQPRSRGRGADVDEGSDGKTRADPQRGENLAEGCSTRELRLPWLYAGTPPLSQWRPLVPGGEPVQEERAAGQGEDQRTAGAG